MYFFKQVFNHHVRTMVSRLLLAFAVLVLCKVLFLVVNSSLIGEIYPSDLGSICKGSLLFDTISLLYVNILFIVLSLMPAPWVDKLWWQRMVSVVYVLSNSMALSVALCDIFYYPYKLARISGDDLYLLAEDNGLVMLGSVFLEYWYIVLLFAAICYGLFYRLGVKCLSFQPNAGYQYMPVLQRYGLQLLYLLMGVTFSIYAIRGFSFSKASFPISVSDATRYVKPAHADLIMSNPFALIRTAGHSLRAPKFTSTYQYIPEIEITPTQPSFAGKNVVLLVLESFGTAYIKSVAESYPADQPSYTPFLDSLFQQGALFKHVYQSGIRSIDAMPAMWASIPSINQQFLSLPQSLSAYDALPEILSEKGYKTAFMHGSVSSSMSFMSFGKMAGVQEFRFREHYEEQYGTADFDGKWGIWDHKFLPYALEEMGKLQQPFFNTIFTLSSHHPFALPEGYQKQYGQSGLPMQQVIRYSDEALRQFFAEAQQQPWYEHTIFVITADHGSGGLNEAWKTFPRTHRVPLFFYSPKGDLPVMDTERMAAHLDVMPTLLALLGHEGKVFGFGQSLFAPRAGRAILGNQSNYCVIDSDKLYRFDDKMLLRTTYVNQEVEAEPKPEEVEHIKAYINSYFKSVKTKVFVRP